MGQLCEESYAEKERENRLPFVMSPLLMTVNCAKSLPQHHWVMQWNGLILVFMVLLLTH
ncbi:hypothetical protein ACNKHT_26865 [Shigella flexneri]